MPQFGGKDSKRHFTVVMGNKEHGLYVSSTPSSAAKKAVTKLCTSNKSKKVEFHIREITQGSKKKTYGPYIGHIEKLKEPIKLKGRVIKYKPVAKLQQKKSKMGGGLFNKKVTENNSTNEGIQKMFENFKVENQNKPAPYHYKKRFNKPNTIYFGTEFLEINNLKYYPYSFLIIDEKPIFRILTLKLNSELSNQFSIFEDFLTVHPINDYNILVIKDLTNFINFIVNFYNDESNLYKYIKRGLASAEYSVYEIYKKQINIYIEFYDMIVNIIDSFTNLFNNGFGFYKNQYGYETKQYEEILKYFNFEDNKKLPDYIKILKQQLKLMKSFKGEEQRKMMKSNIGNVWSWVKQPRLKYIKEELNSYTRNNYDKAQEEHKQSNMLRKLKSEFEPQLDKIFFEKLNEENKEPGRIIRIGDNNKEKIYKFIYAQKNEHPEITNDQLIEKLLPDEIGINILNFMKNLIKKNKLDKKKKEDDMELYRIKKEEDDKFDKNLSNILSTMQNEESLNAYGRYRRRYHFVKRGFNKNSPYKSSYHYIKAQYKELKLQNPEMDDKELIKKILEEGETQQKILELNYKNTNKHIRDENQANYNRRFAIARQNNDRDEAYYY